MALAGEVGELVSELQWLTDAQVVHELATHGELCERLADEAADVLIYLARFADSTGIDLLAAANAKMDRNEARYPRERVRGSARKYDRLSTDPPDGGNGEES